MDKQNLVYFLPLIIWEIIWKGIALWKAARNWDKNWFIALLIINSVGILPIIYIYFFAKKENEKIVWL